jgi:hypothetical protein
MLLHLWECLHPGCGESFSALGIQSLLLHVNNHNKSFHSADPVLDGWSLERHPGYKPPDGSTAKRERDSRLEPYGMCQTNPNKLNLTEDDKKWLTKLYIGWR